MHNYLILIETFKKIIEQNFEKCKILLALGNVVFIYL
jgi:hypothetical protein